VGNAPAGANLICYGISYRIFAFQADAAAAGAGTVLCTHSRPVLARQRRREQSGG